MNPTQDDRKARIDDHPMPELSKEAVARKLRSLERLRKEGVPVLDHLPVIEDEAEAKNRTTVEIARRTIAVILSALKGEGLDQPSVDSLVGKYGAGTFFSPEELAFIHDASPGEADTIKFSWRYECAWVLLWSLGYVATLARPDEICDVPELVRILRSRDTARFIQESALRPLGEILDQADLIYRYDWAATEARVKNRPTPSGLDGGVIHERHRALNWLTGYMDQEWDDITTDT